MEMVIGKKVKKVEAFSSQTSSGLRMNVYIKQGKSPFGRGAKVPPKIQQSRKHMKKQGRNTKNI